MIEYIYNPTLWVILGIFLILFELTDGSKIFFLPFGLGSIANSGLIFFQNNGSFNQTVLLKYWHSPLISLALFAAFFAITLRVFSKSAEHDKNTDINNY